MGTGYKSCLSLVLLAATTASAGTEARARLAEHLITLSPETAWPEEVVRELARGLDHLPPKYRTPPGGPLELQWSPQPQPFGMGDGSNAAPDWSDGKRRFHLYAYRETTERRASYRLEQLPPQTREALWRRRALVHAVLARWNEQEEWSDQPRWRRLNGWVRPFQRLLTWSEQPLNLARWAYSRERGRSSPALDLLTFAEEALVPVEALAPGALAEADQLRCQEFSKSRVLTELGLLTVPRGPCQRYDAWASPGTLEGIEFLFVAASGRAPESLFGHLLMRVARSQPGRVDAPGLTPAVQLVALTGGDLPGPAYVLRGLTGGYPMVLMTVPMLDVTRQMLEFEQRTMRRFRLRLTPGESQRLLERIWELERRGRLDYRFLHDNCAFAAAFVLNGALEDDKELRLPSGITPLLPATTLDAVARVQSSLGGPLLEPIFGSLDSTRDLARSAHAQRTREATRLGPALASLHRDAESPHGAVRLAAYQRLARLAPEVAPPEALFSYLAHSVDLERYAFDAAEAQAIKARLAALVSAPPVPDGNKEADQRERQFEREQELEGAIALLDRPQRLQSFLEGLPRRVFTVEEQRHLDEATAAEARLNALLQLQAELNNTVLTEIDPVRWLREDRDRRSRLQAQAARHALGPSGYARSSGALGVTLLGARPAPSLTLRSAAFSEELGDHRLHGLDPAAELTTLAGEVVLIPGPLLPQVRRSQFLAVRYRNLRREPAPLRQGPWGELGWGFQGGWSYDARRTFSQRAFLAVQALAVLDDTPDLSRLTTFGMGVHGALGLEGLLPELIAGPRLTLTHRRHLGGNDANALRLEVSYAPAYLLFSSAWQQELEASLRLGWLTRLGRFPVILTAGAGAEWIASPKHTLAPIPTVTVGLEPLAF